MTKKRQTRKAQGTAPASPTPIGPWVSAPDDQDAPQADTENAAPEAPVPSRAMQLANVVMDYGAILNALKEHYGIRHTEGFQIIGIAVQERLTMLQMGVLRVKAPETEATEETPDGDSQ